MVTRVELKDYEPILAVVRYPRNTDHSKPIFGKIVDCKEASLIGTRIWVIDINCTLDNIIDLKPIGINNFNSSTRRWRFRKNPMVHTFEHQLVEDTHPLCFIPEKYRSYPSYTLALDNKPDTRCNYLYYISENCRDLFKKQFSAEEDQC